MQQRESYAVTQLVAAFRHALHALVASVETVGVTWTDGEAYDNWSLLEETLFDVIVAASVLPDDGPYRATMSFPTYGFSGARFSTCSWIEVDVPERRGTFAFIRLGSPPGFDDIVVARIDGRRDPTEELTVVPWAADRQFFAQLRSADGELSRVDAVTSAESVVATSDQAGDDGIGQDASGAASPTDLVDQTAPEEEHAGDDLPFHDQVMASVRRQLRLAEHLLTPSLRAVAVNPRGPDVAGRFIYATSPGDTEWEKISLYETYLCADFHHPVTFSFTVEYRPASQLRTLLPGEVWAFLRQESDREAEEAAYQKRQQLINEQRAEATKTLGE